MTTTPNIEVLEKLQSLFKCQQCGNCCSVGGDMKLCTKSIQRMIREGIFLDRDAMNDVMVPCEDDPSCSRFVAVRPCWAFDRLTRQCTINWCKPYECDKFPFLLLAEGGCTYDALALCPGAQDAMADYLGVPHGEVRISVRAQP